MTHFTSDDTVFGLGNINNTPDLAAVPLMKLTTEQAVRLRAVEWFLSSDEKPRGVSTILDAAAVVADYILSGKMPERQPSAVDDKVTTLVRK